MLQGQVRAAVRFIADRVSGGGILSPDSPSNVPGMTVFDVLAKKHPEPSKIVSSTFLPCDTLPPLSDLDITGGHVEKIARRLQGAAGPGGSSAMQWHDYLLRHGRHSAQLRDSVAVLARRLANGIVEWDEIRALVANRLVFDLGWRVLYMLFVNFLMNIVILDGVCCLWTSPMPLIL